ncbi:hypothetical protein ACFWEJ_18980 [Promicromonospora sp. NPDC060204]|uniref:hypothetical protein n=1 Tax=Promicromonospora sp. NPDC060204 TaxID=3347071 RepID=UPI003669C021
MSGSAGVRTVLAVAALALMSGCQADTGITMHGDDDEHPLSLHSGGGAFAASAEDRAPGGTWTTTFGSFFPCIADGDGPIVIDGVDWTSDKDLDPLSVRVFLRSFDDSSSDPIASMRGTPLQDGPVALSGSIHEGVDGFRVERTCADSADNSGQTEELLVAVKSDEGGAHVGDLTVRYTTPDGRKFGVVSEWQMYICGSEAPENLCDGNPAT